MRREGKGVEEESHEEVWMLIFLPVPTGNVPSQEKIGGGGEGAQEGGDLKLISHSYLDTRGCRSSAQASWCHSNDGSPSSALGCEVTIWGQGALSPLGRSLQATADGLQTSTTNSKAASEPMLLTSELMLPVGPVPAAETAAALPVQPRRPVRTENNYVLLSIVRKSDIIGCSSQTCETWETSHHTPFWRIMVHHFLLSPRNVFYAYWCVSTTVDALQRIRRRIAENSFNSLLRLHRALGRGGFYASAPACATSTHAAPRSPTLPLELRKQSWQHAITCSAAHEQQQHTGRWHLLVFRTGKDEKKETGLGPFCCIYRNQLEDKCWDSCSVGLREKPSSHMQVCVQTHL